MTRSAFECGYHDLLARVAVDGRYGRMPALSARALWGSEYRYYLAGWKAAQRHA